MNIYLPAGFTHGEEAVEYNGETDFVVPIGTVPVSVTRACTVSLPKFESASVTVAMTAWAPLNEQVGIMDRLAKACGEIVDNARSKLVALRNPSHPICPLIGVEIEHLMSVTYGLTLNMGDYDFEKFSLTLSAPGGNSRETYDDLSEKLSKSMNDARKRIRSGLTF